MLDQVTAALTAIQAAGEFAVEQACDAAALHLAVKGVGPIDFPITAATARQLCDVARPAPFGKRDQTLHDPSVRDSWEIEKRQVTIDARPWNRALAPHLATIRRRLGLPEQGRLKAEFDKLLVYGPGQFFAPHQDSERSDDMVGTLVVDLPSAHSGGSVVVQHRGQKKVFRGPKATSSDLSLLAFYADCHHEVKPVKSGYRIALTYHLLYQGGSAVTAAHRSPATAAAIDRLAGSVERYFATPIAADGYVKSAPQRPDRLVYLLDHEYTQKSLAWKRLKNGDRIRVAALAQVAKKLDCESYLALAEVHENWSCEGDDDYGYGWRRRGRRYRDLRADAPAADYELTDLNEATVELRDWVAGDGETTPAGTLVPPMGEVCFTTDSDAMDPFKSDHEGYMGNYGNTVDRWYHRAAMVLWPRERNFVIRAKLSAAWAVDELASLIKQGELKGGRDRAASLLPFWNRSRVGEPSAALFRKLLVVATALGDAEVAHGLLAPCGHQCLLPGSMTAFIPLVERFGLPWSKRLFQAWTDSTPYNAPSWLPLLPGLSGRLAAGGGDLRSLAAWLLAREIESFRTRYTAAISASDSRFGAILLAKVVADLVALFEAAAAIQATAAQADLIALLIAPATALPLMTAAELLETCAKGRTPAAVNSLRLQRLHRHVADEIARLLALPARATDDWSIEPPAKCACARCGELAAFLRDHSRIEHAWPLAEANRAHIAGIIDGCQLPVEHTLVRRGSPHTLLLKKLPTLFTHAAALRGRQKALLAWLEAQRRLFSDHVAGSN